MTILKHHFIDTVLSAVHCPGRTLLLALVLLACVVSPVAAEEIPLAAALSLKEAVGELSEGYAKRHPGTTFVLNSGASGVLAKQIENGAPADLFFSADLAWMDYLQTRGLVAGESRFPFAHNTLVFVGRKGIKAGGLDDLLKLERIAIGSPRSAPVGAYALAALKKAGIEKSLAKKLVMARDVRECLLYVSRGEVDGAFVYRTDALLAGGESQILFTVPQSFYPQVICPVALTAAGAKKGEAIALLGFLKSAEVTRILVRRGFVRE